MIEMLHRDQYLQDRPTTQAAEGLPRYRWTVAEIDKLSEAGFFRKEDRFELIGGEIVPMQSKGTRHERVKMDLNLHLARTLRVPCRQRLLLFLRQRSGFRRIRMLSLISRCFRDPLASKN